MAPTARDRSYGGGRPLDGDPIGEADHAFTRSIEQSKAIGRLYATVIILFAITVIEGATIAYLVTDDGPAVVKTGGVTVLERGDP